MLDVFKRTRKNVPIRIEYLAPEDGRLVLHTSTDYRASPLSTNYYGPGNATRGYSTVIRPVMDLNVGDINFYVGAGTGFVISINCNVNEGDDPTAPGALVGNGNSPYGGPGEYSITLGGAGITLNANTSYIINIEAQAVQGLVLGTPVNLLKSKTWARSTASAVYQKQDDNRSFGFNLVENLSILGWVEIPLLSTDFYGNLSLSDFFLKTEFMTNGGIKSLSKISGGFPVFSFTTASLSKDGWDNLFINIYNLITTRINPVFRLYPNVEEYPDYAIEGYFSLQKLTDRQTNINFVPRYITSIL